jgi:hypothetical protein
MGLTFKLLKEKLGSVRCDGVSTQVHMHELLVLFEHDGQSFEAIFSKNVFAQVELAEFLLGVLNHGYYYFDGFIANAHIA